MGTYKYLRPLLFQLDPEVAHGLAISALRALPHRAPPKMGPLGVYVAGLVFPTPLGLAAGFDKSAEAVDAVLGMGFGFAEVGSVTPLPQSGNPRPRLFRLAQDRAIINRMGFNNDGAEAVVARLERRVRAGRGGFLGINIGANRDAADRIADYARMAGLMAPFASYLAVNVSSPNTPGLRALQDAEALREVLNGVIAARDETGFRPPIFLKVAPDLGPGEIDAIARVADDLRLGALIISNTTISRPPLRSALAAEAGGLSGAPLAPLALQRLRDFRKACGRDMSLISVGGIFTAADAWARIRAGASLVQLYSALIYEGPGIARRLTKELDELMLRDRFPNIAAAVGSERRA